MKIMVISVLSVIVITFLVLSIVSFKGCVCPDATCESTQLECPTLDCPKCQACTACPEAVECPEVVTCQPEIIKQYVCPSGDVVDSAILCVAPEPEQQLGELIESVDIKPSCIYGKNGGTINFKVGSIASEIEIQVRVAGDDAFATVHTMENMYEGIRQFEIAGSTTKWTQADFSIIEQTEYELRMAFYIPSVDEIQYSNVFEIDTKNGSNYLEKICN